MAWTICARLGDYKKEFERYIGDFEDESENASAKKKRFANNKVFVVHGHDGELKEKVAKYKEQGIEITLVVVKVGNDPASAVYVRNKEKACEYVGINSKTWHYLKKQQKKSF